ncbi:hypothetical protein D052_1726 [Vibrio parahaemolyticus 10290]|nr:hypothetical protein D052_1726 [Vibrio parahaemolyticus 10290]
MPVIKISSDFNGFPLVFIEFKSDFNFIFSFEKSLLSMNLSLLVQKLL